MKRILSLILVALLAPSALVACETTPAETNAPATDPVATETLETDAPESSYEESLVTKDGVATAHIVVAEGADALLSYAAEELAYHIQKVSGAEIATVTAASDDGLAIVIGTPDTNPELNELFADDIAWLTTLEEDGKRYGSDGFAIRSLEGKLYIFGATVRGALNGVYDFIEDNMGVLWIRADEEIGLVYDEMPTITVAKTDYREKSPFEVRGWNLFSLTAESSPTTIMLSRNKLNSRLRVDCSDIGISSVNLNHNAKSWVLSSPLYDPNETEYWCTDGNGNRLTAETSPQINYWSDLTADVVAASMIAYLDANPAVDNIGLGTEDNSSCSVLPESNESFEYAPGEVVAPDNAFYFSTVFFTFLNKVAVKVKEAYPDITIYTFAYWMTEKVPLCELEDNISVVYASTYELNTDPRAKSVVDDGKTIRLRLERWNEFVDTNDFIVYNYYGCSRALARYERPIWRRIQTELTYYAEHNYAGVLPEGQEDNKEWVYPTIAEESYICDEFWDMNSLTYWIYSKLAWNPYEDVDALINYFCDKVYGEASEHMRNYYILIEKGMAECTTRGILLHYEEAGQRYVDLFVRDMGLGDSVLAELRAAYDAAETDVIKARILPIIESFEETLAVE